MTEVVTGEAVALDLRTAALPSRVVAALADGVLQGLLLLVAGIAFAVSSLDVSEAVAATLLVVLLVLVLAVYPISFETLWRGRTPGKALMGLRVVRDDGGPIGFRQALVRGLAGAFLEKPGATSFVLPVVVSLLNRHGKRVGDLLAGTVVVRDRVRVQAHVVAVMPPPLAGWARTLELAGLPDPLALSVRQFVARAPGLTPAAREDVGGRLVASVRACTAPPPPPGTPGWAFLAAVLAERTRRETERLVRPRTSVLSRPAYGPPGGHAPPPGPATPRTGGPEWTPHPGAPDGSPGPGSTWVAPAAGPAPAPAAPPVTAPEPAASTSGFTPPA